MTTGRSGAGAAGVVGWPVAHSRSPQVFAHWLRRYGIAGVYRRHAFPPEGFADGVRGLQEAGLRGCNVTLPHKEAACALADRRSATADRIGSVNTLVFAADGCIEGDSTDGFGFWAALRDGLGEAPKLSGPVAVVGAGGAARAVVDRLARESAPEIRVINRSLARAEALVREMSGNLAAVALEDGESALQDACLLVNTTSLGMADQPPLELALENLAEDAAVMDLVYAPLETPLLARARSLGLRAVDGLGMLLHQARPGFCRWFGRDPEVDQAVRSAALAELPE